MKKLIIGLIILAAILFFGIKIVAAAPCSVIQGCTGRGTTTANSIYLSTTSPVALTVLPLGAAGTILQSNGSTLNYVATSTLGFAGSSATTTINGLSSISYTFSSGNSILSVATSAPSNIILTVSTSTIQGLITLTTTGTSGAATYSGGVLNIPQYQAAGNYLLTVSTSSPITGDGTSSHPVTCPTCVTNAYASSSYFTLWNTAAGSNILITTSTNPSTIAVVASPTFTNGTFTGTLGVTGLSTFASTTINGTLTVNSIANCNSTQFLQITSGLFGCGTPSGGGGSAGGGFATSTPNIISTTFPNTTGAIVGINSSTPIANLSVVGIAGSTTPEFVVASSTGAINLQVTSGGQLQMQGGTTLLPAYSFTGSNNSGLSFGSSQVSMSEGGTDITDWGSNFFRTNQRIIAENGTAGNPSYEFNNTNNTGMWAPANNTIGFSTNAVQVGTFSPGGSFGINSTTPNATLVVSGYSGSTTPDFIVTSSSNASLFQVNASGNVGIGTTTPINTLVVIGSIQQTAATSSYAAFDPTGKLIATTTPSGGTATASGTAGSIQFAGAGSTFNADQSNFFWNNTSKFLGIGTSSPWANLTVQGNSSATSTYLMDIASSTGSSYLMVANTGRIGIGTTTPGANLMLQGIAGQTIDYFDIASSTGPNVFQVAQNSQSVLSVGTSSSASNLIVQGNASFPTQTLFIFASSTGASLMTLLANGNAGVATSNPISLFTVAGTPPNTAAPLVQIGNGVVTNTSGAGAYIGINDPTGNPDFINFQDAGSGTNHFEVQGNGTVNALQASFAGRVLVNAANMTDYVLGNGNNFVGAIGQFAGVDVWGMGYLTSSFQSFTAASTTLAWSPTGAMINTTTPNRAALYIQNPVSTSTMPLLIAASSTGTSLFQVNANGKVGINTATPGSILSVQGNSYSTTTNGDTINLISGSGVGGSSVSSNGGAISVTAGNGGVGSLTSGSGGSITLTAGTSSGVGAPKGGNIILMPGSGSTAGGVGINTTTASTTLFVAGTITQTTVKSCVLGLTSDANGSITGCSASDARLKKDIDSLPYNPDIINKLSPVLYNWIDGRDGHQSAGFIAQQVGKVAPQCEVSAGLQNGVQYYGVDSNCILALVVNQLQHETAGIVAKATRSAEENWQDGLIILLIGYAVFNEIDKKRKKM